MPAVRRQKGAGTPIETDSMRNLLQLKANCHLSRLDLTRTNIARRIA
jgi:hypothetical protein